MRIRTFRILAAALMTALLLTQVSACLRIPPGVRAELEPDEAQRNHFADEAVDETNTPADETVNP